MSHRREVVVRTVFAASTFVILMPLYLWMSSLHIAWGGLVTGPLTLAVFVFMNWVGSRVIRRRQKGLPS